MCEQSRKILYVFGVFFSLLSHRSMRRRATSDEWAFRGCLLFGVCLWNEIAAADDVVLTPNRFVSGILMGG